MTFVKTDTYSLSYKYIVVVNGRKRFTAYASNTRNAKKLAEAFGSDVYVFASSSRKFVCACERIDNTMRVTTDEDDLEGPLICELFRKASETYLENIEEVKL